MKQGMKLCAIATMLSMTSACLDQERPATASSIEKTDLCLIDKYISFNPPPSPRPGELVVEDPGNIYDSKQTLDEIFEHNRVRRKVCDATE